jgi:hypothetical protein
MTIILRPALLRIVLTLLLPLAMISLPSPVAAADNDQPQYYELRTYLTKSADQQQRINDYWQNAAIPAYNRMGIQPVGVFTEIQDSATNRIYVLIPCDSLEIFGKARRRRGLSAGGGRIFGRAQNQFRIRELFQFAARGV